VNQGFEDHPLIAAILPAAVAVEGTRADILDFSLAEPEEEAVGQAVAKRRREFVSGRACAHRALGRLGVDRAPIPSGPKGEPVWPREMVGSITHCEGYRAAAVAMRAEVLTLGIDAEPDQPLPSGVLEEIALPAERDHLRALRRTRPEASWERLLFCAKEAVYKAWFPLAARWLGFEDAEVRFQLEDGTFHVRLLVPGPPIDGLGNLESFTGRWLISDGLLLTAIVVPQSESAANGPLP
jgi:4'-phosphopantetheinyl transferase EntD